MKNALRVVSPTIKQRVIYPPPLDSTSTTVNQYFPWYAVRLEDKTLESETASKLTHHSAFRPESMFTARVESSTTKHHLTYPPQHIF